MRGDSLGDLILDRKIRRIIRELGERPIAELIRRHCAQTLTCTSFEGLLDEYLARLDRTMLDAAAANRFPATPIHLVPR
jgi:hypothetical protein